MILLFYLSCPCWEDGHVLLHPAFSAEIGLMLLFLGWPGTIILPIGWDDRYMPMHSVFG
jgi:hypothetical protein